MSATEPQHIRYERLQQVCRKALEESQKVLSDENLASCYPTLANSQEGRLQLQMVKAQIMESWAASTEKEFTAIFEERELQRKLDDLDELIAEAQSRKDQGREPQIPMDQLTPINIISSHLIPAKEANLRHLQTQLGKLKTSNAELLNDLQMMVKDAGALRGEIIERLENVDKMSRASTEANLQGKLKELAEFISSEERK